MSLITDDKVVLATDDKAALATDDKWKVKFPSTIRSIAIITASAVTSELPVALLHALQEVHPYPENIYLATDYQPDDETILYILICPAGYGSEYYIKGPKYYITYQLEPTPILERHSYRCLLADALLNWEYSQKNIDFLHSPAMKKPVVMTTYVPPGYMPYLDRSLPYIDSNRDIDVLFLGWDVHPRRAKIRDGLTAAGYKTVFICGKLLPEMQDLINRAKICLNMRASDDIKCLETIRLNVLLSNRSCIVNERIDDEFETKAFGSWILNVPYDNIISTCGALLHNYEYRRQMADTSYSEYSSQRRWTKLVDFSKILPELGPKKFNPEITDIAIFNCSFGTRELAPPMLSAIRRSIDKPWRVNIINDINNVPDSTLCILICPAGLGANYNPKALPKNYICWQLEDMQGNNNNPKYLQLLRGGLAIWDYSRFTIDWFWRKYTMKVDYCPPGFNEFICDPEILYNNYLYSDDGKDIDILFLGYCDAYPRRCRLRDQIKALPLTSVFESAQNLDGMRALIRRAKVCLNFNSMDVFVLSKVRMNIHLSNMACVISENCCDADAQQLYGENGVTFVPYDQIVSTAVDHVNNLELRREKAIKGYQWYSQQRWEQLFDFAGHLPQ